MTEYEYYSVWKNHLNTNTNTSIRPQLFEWYSYTIIFAHLCFKFCAFQLTLTLPAPNLSVAWYPGTGAVVPALRFITDCGTQGAFEPNFVTKRKIIIIDFTFVPIVCFFQLCTLTASEADMKKNLSVHWKYYIASQCAQQYHSFLLPRNFLKGTISIFKETHTYSIFCTKVSITWVLLGSPQQATIIRRNTS